MEKDFQVPTESSKIAFLIEKGMPNDRLPAIFKEADEVRKAGHTVCVTMMKKNKKFQKDQMMTEGYTEFKEFFKK